MFSLDLPEPEEDEPKQEHHEGEQLTQPAPETPSASQITTDPNAGENAEQSSQGTTVGTQLTADSSPGCTPQRLRTVAQKRRAFDSAHMHFFISSTKCNVRRMNRYKQRREFKKKTIRAGQLESSKIEAGY